MTLATLLAILVVVVAMPINWYVVARLWGLHRASPLVRSLRERGIVATALALIVTVFAVVFVNNELRPPPLDSEATKLITRSAVLALSIPALYWLWLYRR